MTFIATITGRDSIWLVADRRLSCRGKPVNENAKKVMVLETTDGIAILGYAGLGATAAGTQPSDWMSRIVRGRNWPLEPSLGAIADGMKLRLPRHLKGVPGGHVILGPAFQDKRTRLYSIDIAADRHGRQSGFRYTRWNTNPVADQPPRFALTGSGSHHVPNDNWKRSVSRLVKAHDRKRVSARVVADELAKLNFRTHQKDPFTGPKCVVVWRYAKHGRHKGGGGHQFYNGIDRVNDADGFLPTIGNGMDVSALVKVISPFMKSQMDAVMRGESDPGIDHHAINAALARLDTHPDDELR